MFTLEGRLQDSDRDRVSVGAENARLEEKLAAIRGLTGRE